MGNRLITNLSTAFEATRKALNKMKHTQWCCGLGLLFSYTLLVRRNLFMFKGAEICIYCLSGDCLTYHTPGSFKYCCPTCFVHLLCHSRVKYSLDREWMFIYEECLCR